MNTARFQQLPIVHDGRVAEPDRQSSGSRWAVPSRAGWLMIALLIVTTTGCTGGGKAPQVTATPPINFQPGDLLDSEYRLAAGDVLGISFPYRPALDQDVVVRDDGRVTLPLIGAMEGAGHTPEELQRASRAAYSALGSGYTPEQKEYRIGAGDVLELRFQYAPELNLTLPVRPDGRITVDRARDLLAEGRTPRELEESLRAAYTDYLARPDVAVIVRDFASNSAYVGEQMVNVTASQMSGMGVAVRSSAPRQVFVTGEVRTPGFLPYHAPMTLLQAVVSAGGVIRGGQLERVLVLRKVGTEEPTATLVDLTKEFGGSETSDIPLRPYDIVVIPKTRIARVNDVLDQYLYQLIPASRNVNFTYFYDISGRRPIQ